MIERFLGDRDLSQGRLRLHVPSSGRKIAVVGAGPAGITAAYFLSLAGHDVVVFDDKPQPGGYLRTGIPDYRLPKEILNREIEAVARLGARFVLNTHVGSDISIDDLKKRFNATILAFGLHRSRLLEIPGSNHTHVVQGTVLLERILRGEWPALPSQIAVIGGGNTAIDVARTLWRLGVEPVILYRRTRKEMPAIESEVDEATREGIKIHFLCAPKRVVIERDSIVALECLKMRPGEFDDSGRRSSIPIEGSEFRIPSQWIVTAIGESADISSFPDAIQREVRAAQEGELSGPLAGFFLAGDVATGAGTVAAAVGSGRRVARMVDDYLAGRAPSNHSTPLQALWPRSVNHRRIIKFSDLNMDYFEEEPRPGILSLPVTRRSRSFAEIISGFSEEQAVREARRCFGCGTCNGCSNCLYFCPDVAIHKNQSGTGFTIDLDHQKALTTWQDIGRKWGTLTGRPYGLIEEYKAKDAELVMIAMSTPASSARCVVDTLRERGIPVGLLRLRVFRPFPSEVIRHVLAGKRMAVVLDRGFSFGHHGILHQEVKSALYGLQELERPSVKGIIAGLGGRDITIEDLEKIFLLAWEDCLPEPVTWWKTLPEELVNWPTLTSK
jgi:formate dehydrogenase major subunit